MLLSTIEHAFLRFQILADNSRYQAEHVLQTFLDYLYAFNKPMLRQLGVIFETHCFSFPIDKTPNISFCHYPISMQFRCIVFNTDGLQMSSLIMGTMYYCTIFNVPF